MRKIYPWAILALILLSTLELLTFSGLQLVEYMRPWLFREDFLARHFASLTDDDFQRFRRSGYDPLLGWDNQPNAIKQETNSAGRVIVASYASNGARRDGLQERVNLVATYGDSFTACAEVNDNETWQFYLEKQLGYEVKNFGVVGYGPDQALLKFEKNITLGEISPVVILAVFEANIDRIVNQFRPFYLQSTHERFGFKPTFQIKEGRLVLESNPLTPETTSISEVEETAHKLIQTDYWAKPNLQNRFPYIMQIPSLLAVIWRKSEHLRRAYPTWQDDRVADLMSMIISRFVTSAKAAGVRAVVLFIPNVSLWQEGRREPHYEVFKGVLRRRHPDVVVIDVSEHDFDEERFNILPFAGHASAYGNEQIARILAHNLRNGFDFAELSRPYQPVAD